MSTILDMPTPVSLEDLELEHSLDGEPQCQMPWHLEEYEAKAEWKAVIHCRNKHQFISCTRCKEENDAAWKKREGVYRFTIVTCNICKLPVPGSDPFHWEEL